MRSLLFGPYLPAVIVIAAVAAGCGSDRTVTSAGDSASSDPPTANGLDGPVLRHLAAFGSEGEDAEVRGVLEIEGDCLYVALDEVGERYPVVWPASTTWDRDTERLVLPNGDELGDGDAVYGGGGYRSVDNVTAFAGPEAARRARECIDNRYAEVAVVNNSPDAIAAGDGFVGDEPSGVPVAELGVEADWVVVDLVVDGTPVDLDPSVPVTANIQAGQISGVAACNEYSGSVDWSEEGGFGRFIVSDLTWTERGCDAELMELEQSFLEALGAVDSYEMADGLYVGRAGGPTSFHLVPPGAES